MGLHLQSILLLTINGEYSMVSQQCWPYYAGGGAVSQSGSEGTRSVALGKLTVLELYRIDREGSAKGDRPEAVTPEA